MSIGILASAHVPFSAATGYAAEVLADSPLVYLRLGESSGTTASDSSGNGRDGTYYGIPTLGSSGAVSGGDTAVSLDGTNDAITLGDASWMDVTTFTVELWVKLPSSGVQPVTALVWRGNTSLSVQSSWWINKSATTGYVNFSIDTNTGGGGIYQVNTTETFADDTWHHIVGVCDDTAKEMSLYIDGSLYGSATSFSGQTVLTNQAHPIVIGARGTNSDGSSSDRNVQGIVDEFAIYDTALSSTRVAAHYAAA